MQVQLKILRYDPERDQKPHWERYTVEAEPTAPLLSLLHTVKWEQDGELRARGLAITRSYEFHRMTEVNYPYPGSVDVTISYGLPGAAGNRAGRIDAGSVLIHGEGDLDQCVERPCQVRVGDLVTCLAALGLGDHDAAVAQASQMVRHVRARQPEVACQLCRIGGPLQQRHQEP